jgi:hypothetical protein
MDLVHYKIGDHLWQPVEVSHINGWLMLSAIVVNAQPETGEMNRRHSWDLSAARALGVVNDERAF